MKPREASVSEVTDQEPAPPVPRQRLHPRSQLTWSLPGSLRRGGQGSVRPAKMAFAAFTPTPTPHGNVGDSPGAPGSCKEPRISSGNPWPGPEQGAGLVIHPETPGPAVLTVAKGGAQQKPWLTPLCASQLISHAPENSPFTIKRKASRPLGMGNAFCPTSWKRFPPRHAQPPAGSPSPTILAVLRRGREALWWPDFCQAPSAP